MMHGQKNIILWNGYLQHFTGKLPR